MGKLVLLALSVFVMVIAQDSDPLQDIHDAIIEIAEPELSEVDDRLTAIMRIYGQTVSWQQQVVMERMRYEGDSGLQQVRVVNSGTKPWAVNSWARTNGQAAIHNHANNIRTVGMGDFGAVMNGVSFRTRHNDYRLNKAHSTSSAYGEYEPIEFPEIPPSVTAKATIAEQVAEMKEYFKAFAEQSTRNRDYRPYFKPVLTYMQGMWTVPKDAVEEPFFSDRHRINADTWFQLQEDVMYNAWTGKKDVGENLAVLPTMIYGVNDDGSPKVAQWNYKILAHPLEQEVPLNRFRVVDDLALQMRSFRSKEEFAKTRSARFQLHPKSAEESFDGVWRDEGIIPYNNFLEELMNEVPGLDNYQANIPDSNFGEEPLKDVNDESVTLNAGYYHRYYALGLSDASGFTKAQRGFSDANLFVALNSQVNNTAPIRLRKCSGWRNCEYEEVHASYAIPLEIVYMTPLNRWNPYDISMNLEDKDFPRKDSDGRWTRGGRYNTTDDAYNGASETYYYLTPAEMFEGGELGVDSADTTKDSVYILDSQGNVRRTVASGTRIFLPNIPDIGSIRTRYPIFPVHQEGSNIYKELSALKDLVINGASYSHLYERPLGGFSTEGASELSSYEFALRKTDGFGGPHTHTFELTGNQIAAMREGVGNPGYLVQVETSTQSGHTHTLKLRMRSGRYGVFIYECNGRQDNCPDGHPMETDCVGCPLGMLQA